MFYYIEGKVSIPEPNMAVLDCGGVGYAVYTTANTLSRLEPGKTVRLYTYCNVKEDAFDIYGFYDRSEKRSFEMLLSVSGVGPKAAISILSASTPEMLAVAIINGDERVLTSAPGIGKRIAQRIMLELKDKVKKEMGALPAASSGDAKAPSGSEYASAEQGLMVLGYSRQEITAALKGVDVSGMSAEEIIRAVLKNSLKE